MTKYIKDYDKKKLLIILQRISITCIWI